MFYATSSSLPSVIFSVVAGKLSVAADDFSVAAVSFSVVADKLPVAVGYIYPSARRFGARWWQRVK